MEEVNFSEDRIILLSLNHKEYQDYNKNVDRSKISMNYMDGDAVRFHLVIILEYLKK